MVHANDTSQIADQNNKYQGCYCIDDTDFAGYNPPQDPSDQDILADIAHLPYISGTSYSEDPDLPLNCQKAGWGAPQRDEDGTPSVTGAINDWCGSIDGQKITKAPGIDTLFKMWAVNYYSFFLSASYWYAAPSDHNCGNDVTLSKDECVKDLTYAMTQCDPDSGSTYGGGFASQCTFWNITMDGQQNADSPPWNPLSTEQNSGSCDRGTSSGVTAAFWKGIYPKFCTAVDADTTKKQTMQLSPNDYNAPSQKTRALRLRTRTPPPGPGDYQDKWGQSYSFEFDWPGANGNCRKTCSDAMSTLATSCKFERTKQRDC